VDRWLAGTGGVYKAIQSIFGKAIADFSDTVSVQIESHSNLNIANAPCGKQ
jgi:hypothetical protein